MKKQAIIKAFIASILILSSIFYFPSILEIYKDSQRLILSYPSLSPFIYSILMIGSIIISPIPSSPLAIFAGSIFGPWNALIYTLLSATAGAVIAFSISRFFLRDYLKKHIENTSFYKKIEGKNNLNIAYIVFLSRLMPQVSFDIVSYAAGLTGLNIFLFTLATFLGMIPIVVFLSFFGDILKPYGLFLLGGVFIFFILYLIFSLLKKSN